MTTTQHVPVLASEVLQAFGLRNGEVAIDGTCGGGGHTRLLAEAVGAEGKVLSVDRDPAAIERCRERLSGLPVQLAVANFADLPELVADLAFPAANGILLDLGLSSDQLADEERGFSYHAEGPLDLRFDTSRGSPAWKLLERLSEKHLADLIYTWGEERLSRRIARAIVQRRSSNPIRTASELSQLLVRVVPRSRNHSIHPATRTFQALRIAVNDELKWAEVAVRRLPELLKPGGKIAVISFHSLEDRIVKQTFREHALLDLETRKPIRPTETEIETNPRSRSARMRVAVRKPHP